MSITYVFRSLEGLAQLFEERAKGARAQHASSKTETLLYTRESRVWECAADVTRNTIINDANIVQEYASEYQDAVEYAATQIWASINRHKGDPRWEYNAYQHNTYERRT